MKTYFNNANGNKYEVLARYFDDVMLLKTESNNYIVARWIKNNEWRSGHYWMNNKDGACNDFYKCVAEEINNGGTVEVTIEAVKNFYKEA